MKEIIEKPCAACGKIMQGTPRALRDKHTCCIKCKEDLEKAKVHSKPCPVCGVAITGTLSQVSKKSTCSLECFAKYRSRLKVTRPCVVCGVEFSGSASKMGIVKTCSKECSAKLRGFIPTTKTCKECGAVMTGTAWHMNHRKFCSVECSAKQKAKVMTQQESKQCAQCGNVFKASPSVIRQMKICRKCSKSNRAIVEKQCKTCGETFAGTPSEMKKRQTCSIKCTAAALQKKTSKPCEICGANMIGGVNIINRRTCGPECLKKWREKNHVKSARAIAEREYDKNPHRHFKGDRKKVATLLIQKHGEKCASCGIAGKYGSGLVLDHCHKTGEARGILCSKCNSALGLLDDSPEKVKALMKYAESFKQLRLLAG